MGNRYTYKYFFAACNCDKLLDERQKAFFNLLITNKSNDNFTEQLSELIVNARHNTQWRKQYMDFEREQAYAREAGIEQGRIEGIEENKIATVKALILLNKISMEDIASACQIPIEEVQKIAREIKL